MKDRILLGLLWTLSVGVAFAGSEQIIKQRARELSNQNNVRQGVRPATPTPTQPGTPSQAATTTVLTPQQQALVRLQTELSSFQPKAPATPEKNQQLARSLMAVAQGPSKPSFTSANALAEGLSAALSQRQLQTATRNRLLQNLNAVLNPGRFSKAQMDDVVGDIQAIFQANGLPRKDAAKISASAQTVASEARSGAAK